MRKLKNNRVEPINLFAIAAQPDRRLADPVHATAELIEQYIRDKKLTAGAVLNPDHAIAERLGRDLALVTGAIDALAMTGLLARRPLGVVISGEVARLAAEEGDRFPTVVQQFEARLVLAPAGAELAVANASDPESEELELLANSIQSKASSGQTPAQADRAFNLALAKISLNPLLYMYTLQLWQMASSHTWGVILGRVERQHEWMQTAAHYRAIAQAAATGRPWAAGRAMQAHLQQLDRRYFSGLAVGATLTTP